MEEGRIGDHEPWPMRPVLLAGLGALLGLAFDTFVDVPSPGPARMSGAAFVAIAGILLALTLERARWTWSVAFALGAAGVAALIFYWNGAPEAWSAGDEWRVFACFLGVAVAAPLFQAARDEGRARFPYAAVHAHAWTDLVIWCAAWAFVGATFLLVFLLSELFNLIGIDLLRDALRESAVLFALGGAAGGAAGGLLRDRDTVLALLQRVVTTILSVLAPLLAAGLVLFVLALPFTGLRRLWDETGSTTPILLAAVAGAFLLANAVIGNTPEEAAKARALRWSAAALAAVMAPLALVASLSVALRIGQHGFTPERLWALVFVAVVTAVAAAYAWCLVRGRAAWTGRVRPTNVRLALGLCGLCLLLATPLIDFGAISARDQLARLESGRIAPDRFDWVALRFDFGRSGIAALERLRARGPTELRTRAAQVLAANDRWSLDEQHRVARSQNELLRALRVVPAPAEVPAPLRLAVAERGVCRHGPCTLYWQPGARKALAVGFACETCSADFTRLALTESGLWQPLAASAGLAAAAPPSPLAEQQAAVARGEVEIRTVARRQVHVGGRPVGEPFE